MRLSPEPPGGGAPPHLWVQLESGLRATDADGGRGRKLHCRPSAGFLELPTSGTGVGIQILEAERKKDITCREEITSNNRGQRTVELEF